MHSRVLVGSTLKTVKFTTQGQHRSVGIFDCRGSRADLIVFTDLKNFNPCPFTSLLLIVPKSSCSSFNSYTHR